jgi:hypothetical protein
MLMGFAFINPGTGKPILTETGKVIFDQFVEGGIPDVTLLRLFRDLREFQGKLSG